MPRAYGLNQQYPFDASHEHGAAVLFGAIKNPVSLALTSTQGVLVGVVCTLMVVVVFFLSVNQKFPCTCCVELQGLDGSSRQHM